MKLFERIAVNLLFVPAYLMLIAYEVARMMYQATAYAAEVLYDGIRHGDWYL